MNAVAKIGMAMTDDEIKNCASRMMKVFKGNPYGHYIADFRNVKIEKDGKRVPVYKEVLGPATQKEFEDHLRGEKGLLIVPVTKTGACSWGKSDTDDYTGDTRARAIAYAKAVDEHGLPMVVELTKSSGAHLAHYQQYNESAAGMRALLADWGSYVGVKPGVEIFPKQSFLAENEIGSGINLPYFNAVSEDCRNYAIDKDGNKYTVHQWLDLIESMPARPTKPTKSVNVNAAADLLSKHWTDGNRDNLNLAVLGTMLRAKIETPLTQEVQDTVMSINCDTGKHVNAQTVEGMLRNGKRVPGFTKLVEYIGCADAQEFMRLCGHDNYVDPEPPFPTELVLDAGAFMALELPEREPIIAGLLYKQSLGEIYGWRGTGKTWFGLGMALAIAGATRFLAWEVPTARRVLYVDGEMAARELQDRLRLMLGSAAAPNEFMLMPSELFYQATDSGLVINSPLQQSRFEGLLDSLRAEGRAPEVIVFDNLSSLTSGIEENSTTEQAQLAKWFARLRHGGYTVLFVHHSGKTGTQRGASGREDNLDLVIKLSSPETLTDQTRMTMEFEKFRGKRPKPDVVEIELMTDRDDTLRLATVTAPSRHRGEIERKFHMLKYLAEKNGTLARKDVAKQFDIGKTAANEHVEKLIKLLLVSGESGPLTVTQAGISKVNDLWPGFLPL